jgi:hypothetical protein
VGSAIRVVHFDRTRKGKRVSNVDWVSPTDPEARITRLKDGRTRLAYKPEHAVDLDTGAILAAGVHPGDVGDTQTLEATLEGAAANLATLDLAPARDDPAEVIADKGYHARGVLKRLADGPTGGANRRSGSRSRWFGRVRPAWPASPRRPRAGRSSASLRWPPCRGIDPDPPALDEDLLRHEPEHEGEAASWSSSGSRARVRESVL